MTKPIVFLISSLALAAACGKKGDSSSPKESIVVKIDKLGLLMDAIGASSPDEAIQNEVAGAIVINTVAMGGVTVEPADKPRSIADAKSDASAFNPKNIKDEKLADGWVLTYDNTGSMGANFFVEARREIAGKAYNCTAVGDTAERQKNAVAACKSLRK